MNTRALTNSEQANLAVLTESGIDHALLFLTETGLRKSILDAVLPVRTLLASAGIHDYSAQRPGPDSKKLTEALLLSDQEPVRSRASLYRPVTKNGDPRIWFSGLTNYAAASDVLAVFVANGQIHVLNLTRSSLASQWPAGSSGLIQLIRDVARTGSAVAEELLGRLREIAASGPLAAVWSGSGAIGRSIERRLGLKENSSRAPDYKGIELKSGRAPRGTQKTRYTLFGCVPNWQLSRYKSSAQILEAFGYLRAGIRQLYCTVSTQTPNPQGLQLRVDDGLQRLIEFAMKQRLHDVAVWELSRLHKLLAEKHRETFWISADAVKIRGQEHFVLKRATHTRKPSMPQFDQMLMDGAITMDHLIRCRAGKVKEHGPLFKLWPKNLPHLFLGKPVTYLLDG